MKVNGHTEVRSWSTYRAWNRAIVLHAWRATREHFGGGWRSVAELLVPALAAMLIVQNRDGAEALREAIATLAIGAAASLLWFCVVFCWYLALAPYRLWCAAQFRITQLTSGRRNDPRAIARDLAICIEEGQAMMDGSTPSKRQLSQWYDRVRRVVSRAGPGERLMLENQGPAPGTRGGALERLILGNRIERLRLILDRHLRPSR